MIECKLNKLNEFCISFSDEIIKEANNLKLRINRRDVSYVNCIGYSVSKSLSIKFLTGDEAFEDMKNVEFVK